MSLITFLYTFIVSPILCELLGKPPHFDFIMCLSLARCPRTSRSVFGTREMHSMVETMGRRQSVIDEARKITHDRDHVESKCHHHGQKITHCVVTHHTTTWCSMQVIDITLMKHCSTSITPLGVVQQKHL
jgi:hypothetical protein